MSRFFWFLLVFALSGFQQLSAQQEASFAFPFQVDQPDHHVELDDDLREISGIALTPDLDEIAAVQDESGIVFFLDPLSGAINRSIEFWKDGDYEDLAFSPDGHLWVVKSKSTLYELSGWRSGQSLEVIKHEGPLSGAQDVEGLIWDERSSVFYLACKGDPGGTMNADLERAVYAYAPNEGVLLPNPAVVIRASELRQWLLDNLGSENISDDFGKLSNSKTDDEGFHFGPSAIARDPITGHWYVASAKGNILCVFDDTWSLLHIEKLPHKVHTQPEGLSFDRQGNLFISNEGKKGKSGCILRFDRRR